MTVIMKPTPSFTLAQVFYCTDDFADQMVAEVIRRQADSIIESHICDQEFTGKELTRSQIVNLLGDIKLHAQCAIADCLQDLTNQLAESLARAAVQTVVNNMSFDPETNMVNDAQVAVNVEFVRP